jgi:hypothetical protein
MMTLHQTLDYVKELHAGHLDRLGRPYHLHLQRVLQHLIRLFPEASEAVRHAALLHGSVEEKKTTLEALRAKGFSEDVIEMVAWNTRPRGAGAPPYLDWIRDLAEHAPLGAVQVRIADNEDNNDPRRIAQLPPNERDVSEYYTKARVILERGLARSAAE